MKEIEIAIEAIDRGSAILRDKKVPLSIEWKSDDFGNREPVTSYDRSLNTAMIETITDTYPDDPIIGEEFSYFPKRPSGRFWTVDSIDGTRSFILNRWGYSSMISLIVNGCPQFGIIHDLEKRDTAVAIRGKGVAVHNGSGGPIDLKRQKYQDNNIAWNPYSIDSSLKLDLMIRLCLKNSVCVESTGLRALLLAKGIARTMVSLPYSPKIWDTAPAFALISELGGQYTDLFGRTLDYKLNDNVKTKRFGIVPTSYVSGLDFVHHDGAFASIGNNHTKLLDCVLIYLSGLKCQDFPSSLLKIGDFSDIGNL